MKRTDNFSDEKTRRLRAYFDLPKQLNKLPSYDAIVPSSKINFSSFQNNLNADELCVCDGGRRRDALQDTLPYDIY